MEQTYENSGVNIEAGEKVVRNIKNLAQETFTNGVLSGIGHFGAFFKPDFFRFENPVLVSSVDGVGTKLKIAVEASKYNTIGQDLVNHCVNDIAVGGAIPLFFLDYIAFGKLDVNTATEIISGFARACKENGVALIGGETAEMPGVYSGKDFDISGTIVGIVDEKKIINGKNINGGETLIGFTSNGLHTNGYSLARQILFPKFSLDYRSPDLELSLGGELLRVHKSYLKLIRKLLEKNLVKALSHITGGGIIGNTNRVVPDNCEIAIDWTSWKIPPLFRFLQKEGNVSDAEMRKVFNLGIGLVAVCDEDKTNEILNVARELNETAYVIGKINKKD